MHKTLFTVTPQYPDQALSQIKQALDIYLGLPTVPDKELVVAPDNDASIHQLVANVYHLKSQLLLANATMSSQDATIRSLQFTNLQQQQLLEDYTSKTKNKEKILDGLVTLDEYEGKGFKINIAEMFRRLRRKNK